MTTKSPRQKRNAGHENDTPRPAREASSSRPKGGMSPLADRKDPDDWAASVDASPATAREAKRGSAGSQATPDEPVGGWVDGSTGRGTIRVPAKDVKQRARASEDDGGGHDFSGPAKESAERSPGAASGTPGGARARRRKDRAQAAAEAAAEERQEEDRNHQGALDDIAEAEEDAASDENR